MSRLRCAYCHDALPAGQGRSCPECLTRLHGECALLLGRCPTLGCPRRWPLPCRQVDRPLTPALRWLLRAGDTLSAWLP